MNKDVKINRQASEPRSISTLAICVLSLALAGVAALFGTPVTLPSKGAAS